ncbi:MAG TPA: rod shape-determining protein [bacterium]|jgi:rod shape-determining protein MreB|nr:rod shape-determining protein [bacterium]HNS34057.1 rod shape-determining protein [bacterium]HNW09593.1 rod shape-determining protein [bacterium]HNZ73097.1 rod shape-determining protein [bacterium]HOH67028.1 rod shape-determining protein [bacterium]
MFKKFFSKINKGLGIDLGSTKTMIYQQDRGIVVNESSVVAVNMRTDQILAVGGEARKMLGKTPPHIIANKPLEYGIISDFEITEKMIRYFIGRLYAGKLAFSARPRVVVGIPLDVTEVEKKAVEDVILSAGASQVFLVENIVAAAIGARIPIQDPSGNMIVNLGGGLTEVAVISLDGIVNWKVSKVAGLALDRDIIKFARDEFNLVLGEMVAEEIKRKIGSAVNLDENLQMEMRGREIVSGLPREVLVDDSQIRSALAKSVRHILEVIKSTLETTPPELVADIYQKGVILTGGTALLKGIDRFISKNIGIPVHIADDPQTCAVRGMGIVLDDETLLNDIAIPSSQ